MAATEELLRRVIDAAPALLHTGRADGYLDFFNHRWLEFPGVPLERVCGWRWTDFVHPDEVDGMVATWRACLVSGEDFEYECRVR